MSSREGGGDGDREGTGVLSGVVLEDDIVETTNLGRPDYYTHLFFFFFLNCVLCLCGVSGCLWFLSYGLLRRLDCGKEVVLLLACVYMCSSSLHLSMVFVPRSKGAPFTLI